MGHNPDAPFHKTMIQEHIRFDCFLRIPLILQYLQSISGSESQYLRDAAFGMINDALPIFQWLVIALLQSPLFKPLLKIKKIVILNYENFIYERKRLLFSSRYNFAASVQSV